jgi:thiol-disulfide isomerase/thioredoxin
MNPQALGRRKLLTYLGLSTVGLGSAAIATSSRTQPSQTLSSSLITAAAERSQLPEFQGISQWLNSPALTVKELKGKVVLVQFWTFACINCLRTLPYLTRWHQTYATKGLQIVGVHTPEFAFERDPNNVKRALKQHGITYPVPIDNEFKTWRAYQNQYWPHLFLADRQGFIRYDHIGEGAYARTEQLIQQLLG